jgi:hypothetical protein
MPSRTEPFVLDLVKEFLEPLTRRSAFKMSRLAVLVDGSTIPVLDLLAKKKFGTWEEDQFPFWVDGDRTNETLSNVGLATKASSGAGRTRSALGVPAGTKEYMKLWRERNKEKVKAAQTKYTEKRRAVLESVVTASERDPILERLLAATRKNSAE